MSPDELIYLLMLIISLPIGFFVKRLPGPQEKTYISTGVGICMTIVLCGLHSLHTVVAICGTIIIVKKVGWRHCHTSSFIFNFSYITFFRAGAFFGLTPPTGFSNVIMLLMTLKLVGIAFEVHDSEMAKMATQFRGRDEKVVKYKSVIENPSVLDMIHYSYCFVGLLTGPYFKFKTYKDWIDNDKSVDVPLKKPLVEKLKFFPLIAGLFLLMAYYLRIDDLKEDAFYQEPFWYRLIYMVLAFTKFRMRMYAAWILSECVCVIAALGAYPTQLKSKCGQGPTVDPKTVELSADCDYDFETIHNIDPYKCDFTPTFRDAMRGWNMSVQWWLKNHVFIRCPIKPLSTMVTMLVSAYWHGIYGGYYLSLGTVPIILIAEDAMMRSCRTEANKNNYDHLNWFFRMRGFEYLSIAFLVLTGEALLRYWRSIYFIGHVVTFIFIGLAFLYKPKRKLPEQKKEGKLSELLDKDK